VGVGKIAVIKSTIIPGTTASLQKKNSSIILLHSPEFLSEASARHDTDNPFMNIIGMSQKSGKHLSAAKLALSILPKAPFSLIVSNNESELIKYAHNCSGFVQIVFFNILYDLAVKFKADWGNVYAALKADPYIPNRYSNPVHKKGRGAGGRCFPKDFEAFIEVFSKILPKELKSIGVLKNIREKNIELLVKSGKGIDLLQAVYGKKIIKKYRH